MTPSARTRKHLTALGWHVWNVEQTIPHTFIKRDMFGWIDLLAVHPQHGILGIQVTSGANLNARIKKARTVAGPLTACLLAGMKLVAHGWALRGPRGARKVWTLREVGISVADLTELEPGQTG
jgi:hypothetical protein